MKKQLIASLIALAMSASLAACGASTDVSESVENTEATEAIELALADDTETEETETEEDAEEVEEDTEAIEEDTETEDAEEDVDPLSAYTFTTASGTMYAQSSVNVRSLPDTTGERLGSLFTNQAVTVDAKCNETGWYEIAFGSGTGYVSGKYLGSSQVAVADTTTTETAATDDAGTADNGGSGDSNVGSSDNGGGSGSSDSGNNDSGSSSGSSDDGSSYNEHVYVIGRSEAYQLDNEDWECVFYFSDGTSKRSSSNNKSIAENSYYIGDMLY